jgi:hypothetical protein
VQINEELNNNNTNINNSPATIKSNTSPKKSSLMMETKPFLENFVLEEKKNDNFDTLNQHIEIKNEMQLELIEKPVLEEEDEEFDLQTLNFFLDFIKNNENHNSKEKVESILEIFNSNKLNNTKINLTNKIKNEILRNLKNEFLHELDELNSIFLIIFKYI